MPFTLRYDDRVKQRDISSMPEPYKSQIKPAIEERLTVAPTGVGKPLRHNLKGSWRLRVGNWRVLYRIEGNTVVVFSIALRRDAYRNE